MNDTPRFLCISRTRFIYQYRYVNLEPVKLKEGATLKEVHNWHQWKLSQYTPTNHIRKITFDSLDACADYIDSMLDDTTTDSENNPIRWDVRAGCLRWFPR